MTRFMMNAFLVAAAAGRCTRRSAGTTRADALPAEVGDDKLLPSTNGSIAAMNKVHVREPAPVRVVAMYPLE
jgi:hypothetical protein